MNILVIGGGGREHALAWKLAQSPKVQMVYLAPGNGGTALDPRLKNINITDPQELRAWAVAEKIALTVVGPEGPLAAGVVDEVPDGDRSPEVGHLGDVFPDLVVEREPALAT